MTPEERAELGARGGNRAHELGTAHKWTVDEAHDAGRLGGRTTQKKKRKKAEEDDDRSEDNGER